MLDLFIPNSYFLECCQMLCVALSLDEAIVLFNDHVWRQFFYPVTQMLIVADSRDAKWMDLSFVTGFVPLSSPAWCLLGELGILYFLSSEN